MFRIAFDPDRPLVATSAFQAGDRVVAAGETFDWRAHGMSEIDALAMFRSGIVMHPADTVAVVAPSSAVSVETPKQKRQRNQRAE